MMTTESELQGDLNFDGATAVAEFDQERLTGQYQRVFRVVRDGRWRTLSEITTAIRCSQPGIEPEHKDSEAAISARLRDLRKSRFGSFTVDRRRRGEPKSGLFEYRVTK